MKNNLTEQLISNFQKRFAMSKEEAKGQNISGEERHADVERIGNKVIITPKTRVDYIPKFIINDVDVMERNLKKYLDAVKFTDIRSTKMDERHNDRYFMFNVWKNATWSDFRNPEKFILRYAGFIQDQTFSEFDDLTPIGKFDGSMIMAQRYQDDYGFETPYVLHLSLTNGKAVYNLPWIRYGISQNRFGDKLAYIYAIQRMEPSHDEAYNEEVKKSINKVNSGVKKYRNVTPSAIAALSIFMGMLEAEGIKGIKAPDFLIGRYGKFSNVMTEEETDRIQQNLTEKFLRNFLRLDTQLDNFRVEPIDVSEFNSFLCMSLDEFQGCKNQAIGELYETGKGAVQKAKDVKTRIFKNKELRQREKFEDYEK